jgi:hypothetical protein
MGFPIESVRYIFYKSRILNRMLHQVLWGGLASLTLVNVSLPAYSFTPSTVTPLAPIVIAQATISDSDLQKFVVVIKQLRKVDKELKPKITKILKDAGFTETRFKEISMNKKDPLTRLVPPLTSQENQNYTKAINLLKPLFVDLEEKAQKLVIASGLTPQQFQAIGKTIQENPKLKEKVQNLLKQ